MTWLREIDAEHQMRTLAGHGADPVSDAFNKGEASMARRVARFLEEARAERARTRAEERRADDEYFRSGTRYPGQ